MTEGTAASERSAEGRAERGHALHLGVLGPLEVVVDGVPARLRAGVPTRLLLHLAAANGRFVPVDRLVELLWGAEVPASGATTLHSHAAAVRKALGPAAGVVRNERGRGYRLVLEGAGVDLVVDDLRFRRLLEEARAAAPTDVRGARALLQEALALWRGDEAYLEIAGEHAIVALTAELAALRRAAQRDAASWALADDDPDAAIPPLEAYRAVVPDDQLVVGQLMRAYAATGRPHRASELYDELLRGLQDRDGARPLAELIALDAQILRHDPTVVGVGMPPASVVAPVAAPRIGPPPGEDLTSLIGRDEEIARLLEALRTHRLVSLVGPAGSGKSRLARVVARLFDAELAGGATVVQLAGCAEGGGEAGNDVVAAQIADELGRPPTSLAALADALAHDLDAAEALLVLDNAEHVLDRVAVAVGLITQRARSVHILVTSREPLLLPGEQLQQLGPLPTWRAELPVRAGEPTPAARFFLERAAAVGVPIDWAVDDETVEQLCVALDGLPFALELAAALLRTHSLTDIARSVHRGEASTVRLRSPDIRHRTLDEAIGWSLDRLDAAERATIEALATCRGTVTAEVVAAIAGQPVTASINRLVERSLLTVHRGVAAPRFGLLATVRAEVRRRMPPATEAALAQRHAQVHTELAERSTAAGDRTHAHHNRADYRAALRWSMEHDEPALGLRLLDALHIDLPRLAPPSELGAWLRGVTTAHPEHRHAAVDVGNSLALLAGEFEGVAATTEEALVALRADDRPDRLARALLLAGLWAVLAGDVRQAAAHLAEAATASADDEWSRAWVTSIEAFLLRRIGRYEEAAERARDALETFEDLPDPTGTILPILTLGRVADHLGDQAAALELLAQGVRRALDVGDRFFASLGQLYIAQIRFARDELPETARALAPVLRRLRLQPNRIVLVSTLEHAAGVATRSGQADVGARLVGYAGGLRPSGPDVPPPKNLSFVPELVATLGQTRYDRLTARGRRLGLDAAITLALSVVDPLTR